MLSLHIQSCLSSFLEYEKKEAIGMGGYAECYHCKHKITGKDYAVKIIDKSADQHVYWVDSKDEIKSKTTNFPYVTLLLRPLFSMTKSTSCRKPPNTRI